jgi:predicted O-methyltransferase YrrM
VQPIPTDPPDLETDLSSIEGWLSDEQGRALYDAASAVRGAGAIVEIGSWKGRSTAWLAAGARRAGRRVYAIDPHLNSREDPSARTLEPFLANLERAGVRDVVEPLVMTSEEAAHLLTGPVELLFIDADHSYAGVRHDADLWLPRVVEGGVVLFHDVSTSSYDGPRRVFRQSICWSSMYDSIERIGSMCVARRVGRRSIPSAAWGFAAGLLLYVYDAKAMLRRLKRRA